MMSVHLEKCIYLILVLLLLLNIYFCLINYICKFFSRTSIIHGSYTNESNQTFSAGYFNTTTAITRVRFKFSSGNIDSGTFKLYYMEYHSGPYKI